MRTKALIVVAAAGLGLVGCVTTPDPGDDLSGASHYTLRLGQRTAHPAPLGTSTDILVDVHMKDGDRRTSLGFRGWDYDGDGRFEMVEVLDEAGGVQARVFDFDGDGAVDMKR